MKVLARIDRRLVIYRHGRTSEVSVAPWPNVVRCADIDEAVSSLALNEPETVMPLSWFQDRFAEGAILWAALENSKPVAWLWVVSRSRLSAWYLPLNDHDKLVYSVVTKPNERGRGVVPRLTLAAVQGEEGEGGSIYLDCAYWNSSARRAFEKIGFVDVGRSKLGALKPLTPVASVSDAF
jgi:hypothetical protein